jgi:hypothetical protein
MVGYKTTKTIFSLGKVCYKLRELEESDYMFEETIKL